MGIKRESKIEVIDRWEGGLNTEGEQPGEQPGLKSLAKPLDMVSPTGNPVPYVEND